MCTKPSINYSHLMYTTHTQSLVITVSVCMDTHTKPNLNCLCMETNSSSYLHVHIAQSLLPLHGHTKPSLNFLCRDTQSSVFTASTSDTHTQPSLNYLCRDTHKPSLDCLCLHRRIHNPVLTAGLYTHTQPSLNCLMSVWIHTQPSPASLCKHTHTHTES